MDELVFYGYFRSSAAYRCRIAFALKGVAPQTRYVHLRRNGGEHLQPAYAAINPQMLVPSLAVGGAVLTQSSAIIEWLEESRPEPRLLPQDPFERARCRAFAQVMAADIHPLANLRVLSYLRTELAQEQPAVDRWARHWIGRGLAACEALLGPRAGGYAFGDRPGMAEIYLIPQLYSARRFGCDLQALPRLLEIEARCLELEAFRSAAPEAQPDVE